MKIFIMFKNCYKNFINHIRESLRTAFFEATVNFGTTGVLCSFGCQYIMERVLPCSLF